MKNALATISPAAGFEHRPQLYVLPCAAVNAFVVGRGRADSVVGVTTGFLKHVPAEEAMAVFAHLLARVRAKDSQVATVMTALMAPVWRMRDYDYTQGEDPIGWKEDAFGLPKMQLNLRDVVLFGTGLILPYMVVVAVTEWLAVSHMGDQVRLAEYADAEGMMLLRDPRSMLRALQHILPRNNLVGRQGARYSALFFCWPGDIPEDEVELRRIPRMRQVLGAAGIEEAEEAEQDAGLGLPPRAPFLETQPKRSPQGQAPL